MTFPRIPISWRNSFNGIIIIILDNIKFGEIAGDGIRGNGNRGNGVRISYIGPQFKSLYSTCHANFYFGILQIVNFPQAMSNF